MSEASKNILSPIEIDAIGEVMNISLGSSATAVSSLLDCRVDITTPKVSVLSEDEFELGEFDPAVGVEITYVAGLDGKNIMILKKEDIRAILQILMQMEIPGDDFMMDEMALSATCEIMNQMMGASATALSEFLGEHVNISTPSAFIIRNADEFKAKYYTTTEPMVVISFRLYIENCMDSEFVTLISVELAKRIIAYAGLGVMSPTPPMTLSPEAVAAMDQQANAAAAAPGAAAPQMPQQPAPQVTGAAVPATAGATAQMPQAPAAQPAASPAMPQMPGGTPATGMPQASAMDPTMAAQPQSPAAQPTMAPPQPTMTPPPAAPQQPAMTAPASPMPQQPVSPMAAPVDPAAGGGYPIYSQPMPPSGAYPGMVPPGTGMPAGAPMPAGMGMPQAPGMVNPQQPRVINVDPLQMQTFSGSEPQLKENEEANLNMLMSVPLQISAEIGRTKRTVKEIIDFTQGTLVVLDKLAGDQVDIFVNGQKIAKGDVVVVDDSFGIKITEIINTIDLFPQK